MSEYDTAVSHLAKQIAKQIHERRTETTRQHVVEECSSYEYINNFVLVSEDIEFFVNEQLPEDMFQKTIDAYKELISTK